MLAVSRMGIFFYSVASAAYMIPFLARNNDIHTTFGLFRGDVELLLKALAPHCFGTNFQ
jgi:hypothetical protein